MAFNSKSQDRRPHFQLTPDTECRTLEKPQYQVQRLKNTEDQESRVTGVYTDTIHTHKFWYSQNTKSLVAEQNARKDKHQYSSGLYWDQISRRLTKLVRSKDLLSYTLCSELQMKCVAMSISQRERVQLQDEFKVMYNKGYKQCITFIHSSNMPTDN
jgi:hypothetical protein